MGKIFKAFVFFFPLFFLLIFAISANAESIRNFQSQITLNKDGSFDVAENISYDFGQNSRHGIFRVIPLVRKVGDFSQTIGITLNGVSRDQKPESYSLSNTANEISIKIGNAGVLLNGVHAYDISYNVKNGLTNYQDHDELYWNVTGNGWNVPIYSASAIVNSQDIPINNAKCFTGVYASEDEQCSKSQNNNAQSFAASNSLLLILRIMSDRK